MRGPFSLTIVLLFLATATLSQQNLTNTNPQQTATTQSNSGVYYAAFRTSAHISRSSPEIFHAVSQDLLDYLKSKGVRVVADPERGILETSDQMSTASMLRLAKLAGASSLLLVTVDRPAASWLKITVQSFDDNGKQLWEENADKKSGLSGKSAPHDVGEKIKSKLDRHVGKEGLPVDTTASGMPVPSPAAKPQ